MLRYFASSRLRSIVRLRPIVNITSIDRLFTSSFESFERIRGESLQSSPIPARQKFCAANVLNQAHPSRSGTIMLMIVRQAGDDPIEPVRDELGQGIVVRDADDRSGDTLAKCAGVLETACRTVNVDTGGATSPG
jgi:hypothetical protein